MNGKLLARLKTTLESERGRLVVEVEEMERAGAENLSEMSGENNYRDHMADQGTATFTRELDMTLVGNTRTMLADVERALARLENGEYGICTRCSEPISDSRIEAVPAAELCITCKEWEEKS